jgi:AbrB family looped-hinge helix DNA binding protein
MKSTATLSSKSQITIPAWARRELGLVPGAKIRLTLEGERLVLEPVHSTLARLEGSMADVYGDVATLLDGLREDRTP